MHNHDSEKETEHGQECGEGGGQSQTRRGERYEAEKGAEEKIAVCRRLKQKTSQTKSNNNQAQDALQAKPQQSEHRRDGHVHEQQHQQSENTKTNINQGRSIGRNIIVNMTTLTIEAITAVA